MAIFEMAKFEQVHPFRVPLTGGEYVRFASLEAAASSAVEHQSMVVHDLPTRIYDLAECRRIYAERRV
jgi:hypothetical protein